jgi:hypothetical protein
MRPFVLLASTVFCGSYSDQQQVPQLICKFSVRDERYEPGLISLEVDEYHDLDT